MDSVVTRSPLLDRYETEVFSLTSSHTTQCINSAAGVLYCCVLAIVHEGYDDSMTAGTTDKNEAELAPLSHIFSSDGEFVDLAQYGLDTFKALLQGATMKRSDCIREDIIVTEGGDFYGQQLARWSLSEEQLAGEVRSNAAIGAATFNINGTTPRKTKNAAEKGLPSMLHATIQGLQIFQQHAVVRRQVLRLLAGDESTGAWNYFPSFYCEL